jgi:hypothetical protein
MRPTYVRSVRTGTYVRTTRGSMAIGTRVVSTYVRTYHYWYVYVHVYVRTYNIVSKTT